MTVEMTLAANKMCFSMLLAHQLLNKINPFTGNS